MDLFQLSDISETDILNNLTWNYTVLCHFYENIVIASFNAETFITEIFYNSPREGRKRQQET